MNSAQPPAIVTEASQPGNGPPPAVENIVIDNSGNSIRISEEGTKLVVSGYNAETIGVRQAEALEAQLRRQGRNVSIRYNGSAGLEITAENPADLIEVVKRLPEEFRTTPNQQGMEDVARALAIPPEQRPDSPRPSTGLRSDQPRAASQLAELFEVNDRMDVRLKARTDGSIEYQIRPGTSAEATDLAAKFKAAGVTEVEIRQLNDRSLVVVSQSDVAQVNRNLAESVEIRAELQETARRSASPPRRRPLQRHRPGDPHYLTGAPTDGVQGRVATVDGHFELPPETVQDRALRARMQTEHTGGSHPEPSTPGVTNGTAPGVAPRTQAFRIAGVNAAAAGVDLYHLGDALNRGDGAAAGRSAAGLVFNAAATTEQVLATLRPPPPGSQPSMSMPNVLKYGGIVFTAVQTGLDVAQIHAEGGVDRRQRSTETVINSSVAFGAGLGTGAALGATGVATGTGLVAVGATVLLPVVVAAGAAAATAYAVHKVDQALYGAEDARFSADRERKPNMKAMSERFRTEIADPATGKVDLSDGNTLNRLSNHLQRQIENRESVMEANSSYFPRWARWDDGVVRQESARSDIAIFKAAKTELNQRFRELQAVTRAKAEAEQKITTLLNDTSSAAVVNPILEKAFVGQLSDPTERENAVTRISGLLGGTSNDRLLADSFIAQVEAQGASARQVQATLTERVTSIQRDSAKAAIFNPLMEQAMVGFANAQTRDAAIGRIAEMLGGNAEGLALAQTLIAQMETQGNAARAMLTEGEGAIKAVLADPAKSAQLNPILQKAFSNGFSSDPDRNEAIDQLATLLGGANSRAFATTFIEQAERQGAQARGQPSAGRSERATTQAIPPALRTLAETVGAMVGMSPEDVISRRYVSESGIDIGSLERDYPAVAAELRANPPTAANGQEPVQRDANSDRRVTKEDFDRNRDGKIDRADFDLDGDGRLSQTEATAMKTKYEAIVEMAKSNPELAQIRETMLNVARESGIDLNTTAAALPAGPTQGRNNGREGR